MPFFTGGVSLFLAFAVVQATSAAPIIRRAYLRYALYLLFILTYFVVRGVGLKSFAEQLEAIIFCGSVVSYMLFARALFAKREAFAFLEDITKLGIFAAVICLVVEKSVHFLTDGVPESWKYVNLADALLRGSLALLGLFVAFLIYSKYPADRNFSGIFLLGNLFLLFGGLIVALITILTQFSIGQESINKVWSYKWRGIVIEVALLLEILCFSLAISRRQALLQNPVTVLHPEPATIPAPKMPLPEDPHPDKGISPNPGAHASQRIAFRTNKGFELIRKSEIVLIQGGGNSANFIKVFKDGQPNPIIVSQTLTHTLRMLSDGDATFQQVHKSYIINIRKICRLYKDEDGIMTAVMDNDMEVPISTNRVLDVKKLLGLE